MKILPILLSSLVLAGCGEPVQDAPQPGDNIQLPAIEWRVRDRAELERIYVANGMAFNESDRLSGFAGWDGDKAVVYTLPPARVDDAATCTLGHEVMHVALGSYHQ